MFRWRLSSITFSGGEVVPIEPGSVLILVGPNNSGKSTALREIEDRVRSPGNVGTVVTQISEERDGTSEDFIEWLRHRYPSRQIQGRTQFLAKGSQLDAHQVVQNWEGSTSLHWANAFVCHRLDTETRLQVSRQTQQINRLTDVPQQYIHLIQADEEMQQLISREVRRAFGVDLVPNHGGGREVWFHVGHEPSRTADRDRISEHYLRELQRQPRLDSEGDGIRSFVGALLASRCGAHPVLLIDEPESFLHPPQIRRLSAFLARSARDLDRQVIIATHSSDVIQGALTEPARVSVCRLVREPGGDSDLNHASVLESARLKDLWSKPLLHSAAAIDGVFHAGVVACEADSDSRFYEAVVQHLEETEALGPPVDLYFIHGGGKGELATLSSTYRELAVHTAVIADLDLLATSSEFWKVVTALGGDPNDLEPLYNTVVSALSSLPPVTSIKGFVSEMGGVLEGIEDSGALTHEQRARIARLLNETKDWSEAKRTGLHRLRGGTRQSANELLDRCRAFGLFLVPVGELERWWPAGPADKNRWYVGAIAELRENPHELREVTEFMTGVCSWFGFAGEAETRET